MFYQNNKFINIGRRLFAHQSFLFQIFISMSVNKYLLRSTGFKVSCLPPFGTYSSVSRLFRWLMLERALMFAACSGSCWHVDYVTVLAVDPYPCMYP